MLLVENLGQYSEYISKGQRVAKLIIEKNEAVKISVVDKLSDTQRGTDGIGSTGK